MKPSIASVWITSPDERLWSFVQSASGCGLVGTSAWLGGLGTPPD